MAEFIKVASTSDLPPGEKMLVEYDDEDVGLFNIDGEYYAISDVCTHDDGPLVEGRLDGDCIICPRHGARKRRCGHRSAASATGNPANGPCGCG